MPLLIDGYNLLWAIQKKSPDKRLITDIQLCRTISLYVCQLNEPAQIIFDGVGPPDKTPFDNVQNIEIIFSGLGIEADDVIEDKIKANFASKRLTVVSSDRRIRKAAKARKAVALKAEQFWNRLEKELARKNNISEPPQKRNGLSQSETEKWMQFFGMKD